LQHTVAHLKRGEKGIILEFQDNFLPIKLLELGCLPGNEIELIQVAPLKDPLYVNVNGTHIAIRREVAEKISLGPLGQEPAQHTGDFIANTKEETHE